MPPAREFLSSANGIVALVFAILGIVFVLTGAVITAAALGAQGFGAPGAVGAAVGTGGFVFLGIGVVIGAVGVGLGALRMAEIRERARLRERGVVCEGVVIDVRQDRRVRVNRRHPWSVRYRYTAGGLEYEGGETMMDLPSTVQQGERVEVVYDATDPRRSALKHV